MAVPQPSPAGFRSIATRLGVKDGADDFVVVVSDEPTTSAAVFTRSRFAGPSVRLSRAAADRVRGVVVVSGNANVATPRGLEHATLLRGQAAEQLGVPAEELLIASTGVIGRPYPIERMLPGLRSSLTDPLPEADFAAVARGIMTTDTRPKLHTARCGGATVLGIAKGVGMIEPDMATLLTFFFTDAAVPQPELDAIFRRVVETTFNALSIDTDTSTSDTAAVIANGAAGPVDLAEFERALHSCALALVKEIAADGEGAGKTITVEVTGARDAAQAKRVGKAVVNSPLVKTAVHGADPNWGRVAMAVGKLHEEHDIDPERVRIAFGGELLFPAEQTEALLDRAARHLGGDQVTIRVELGIADGEFTVYGCDLTEGYVELNSAYTT
ncbi:bifunctional glutamate N-acetyltransferase/amino-acid acetyltransferase ArgJ [Kitasatospora viridis]|uniref:Arginine biosynthesis bifunctional protein ArgJ n=1 Tax=Kitasatospora viridis TaxID=281105 RepID=A0A561SDK4_9ACTN|nr:bifunctional glutamate N-acetyltransferase/amino-acid acetyltransferase ArgJ [Kitasatospora viridis]TWF72952.1 glutamate N-acetyltransferase [Kitasatospora viridis]